MANISLKKSSFFIFTFFEVRVSAPLLHPSFRAFALDWQCASLQHREIVRIHICSFNVCNSTIFLHTFEIAFEVVVRLIFVYFVKARCTLVPVVVFCSLESAAAVSLPRNYSTEVTVVV